MLNDLLNKYVKIDVESKRLESERLVLRDRIIELMEKEGKVKERTDIGTFVIAHKPAWVYSKALLKKWEDLKIAQLREQDKGVAKKVTRPYILFTPK